MAAVLVAASYSRISFSLYVAVYAWRVRVPSGSKFHLELGTIRRVYYCRRGGRSPGGKYDDSHEHVA